MTKKSLLLMLSLVLALTIGLGSTLAYLTDTDGEVNTFTIGDVDIELDEEYEQDQPINPGVEVDKVVKIKNVSENEAWVWYTVAIPVAGEGDDAEEVIIPTYNEDPNWTAYGDPQALEIEGELYNVYTYLWNKKLAGGAETAEGLQKIQMHPSIDYDPVSDTYKFIEKGEEIGSIDYDLTAGKVYVNAYAIQTEGFTSAEAAYAGFMGQWTEDGKNYTEDMILAGSIPTNGDNDSVTWDIPEDAVRVKSTSELEDAVKNGETKIVLADGEYTGKFNAKGKTLELYGESKNAILLPEVEGAEGADYDFDGSNVTFNGLTIDATKGSGSFKGYARMNGTYNDCVIVGEYCLYGEAEFNFCTLNTSGDIYNIRTWGAPNATFKRCTFNSDGKAMLLYGTANTNLLLDSCIFNDSGVLPDMKAAVEIGNDYNKSYTLTVENTTVNGFEINDKGIDTGSTLWGNKNSMSSDKLNVVVDGVDVY